MNISGIFAIIVGILMIGQWTITLLRKQVAGPETGISGRGRVEMAFHCTAEFATAVLLIVSGIGLLASVGWGKTLFFVSTGMLIYSLVNSPGYFAQKRQWPMVVMFGVLLIMAIVGLILVI